MRVLIQISSGPSKGKKIVLGPGQGLKFGRTEWADYAIPLDGQMSKIHFVLEATAAGCEVEDLKSSNGTWVNGQRIAKRTALNDGDEIRAGQTTFAVHIEGIAHSAVGRVPEPTSRNTVRAGPVAAASPLPATGKAALPKRASFTCEKCDSGLILYRGNVADIPPADLAVLLCQNYGVYLIVDFKNLGQPCPPELAEPNYVFDWLPPAAAERASPVIVAQEEYLDWPTLLEQGWGSDAVVCLLSKLEKPALVDHMRQAVRVGSRAEAGPTAVRGLCWPSALAPMLMHQAGDFITEFASGIEGILVELPDLPESWQIFGRAEFAPILEQCGLAKGPR
jgi:hypothetical protein